MSDERKLFVKKIPYSKEVIVNPDWSGWNNAEPLKLNLLPTPLGRQPSEYLKYAQDPTRVGRIHEIEVRGCHNNSEIFFHLFWKDEHPDTTMTEEHPFVDGAGIIMPMDSKAPHTIMVTMGSPAYPINVWYWRADEPEKPRNVVAKGLGTTVTSKKSFLFSKANWANEWWKVVVGRTFALPEQKDEAVQLKPGLSSLVSFAVWDGGNRERAGIKAFCPCEIRLLIEA
jgi:DMSO reductase family type II enzyme heme b subunit